MHSENGWRECRFQDLIDAGLLHLSDGYRAKNRELGGDGLIFLRAGQVTDSHVSFDGVERFHDGLTEALQSKIAATGDTVITTKGNSIGRTAFVTADMPRFVYSPHLSFWRSRDPSRLVPRFLRYWSIGQEFTDQLDGLKNQTDMAPYLSLRDQRRLTITLPQPKDQQVIARILGTLDDKIELNRRMNATLEELARGLFKSWFVDFDPVNAKAAGRKPAHMSAATAAHFPNRFVDSTLGTIPGGWQVMRLGQVCELLYGKALPESRRISGTVPVYGSNGRVGWHNVSLVAGPGIIVGRKGTAGAVTWASANFFPIDTTFYVSSLTADLSLHFLFALLGTLDLPSMSGDSAVPGLNRELAYSLEVVVPTSDLAKRYTHVVLPLFETMQHIEAEVDLLNATRNALLPQLLSGEIRLRDAEKLVGEVA